MNTSITSDQVRDDTIKRQDLNTTVAGSSVIRKALEDQNAIISLSSSGVDAGTGDVTIKHKDTQGYLHIPTGGSVGNFLINSASGTGTWSTDLYWDNTNKRLGVNTLTPIANAHINGSVYIAGGDGDVNTSGTITSADAALVLFYSVGTTIPTATQFARGNISGNGITSFFDAKLINAKVSYGWDYNTEANKLNIKRAIGKVAYPKLDGTWGLTADWTNIGYGFGLIGTSSEIMTFSKNYNVGVGTITPSVNFQVDQPTYAYGKVSNLAGGTTVTGTDTLFTNTFNVGDTITIGGQTVTISAIASNTSMTTSAITNANTNVAYTLVGGNRFSVFGNGTIMMGNFLDTSMWVVPGIKEISLNAPSGTIYIGDPNGMGYNTLFEMNDADGLFSFTNGNVAIGIANPKGLLDVKSPYGDVNTSQFVLQNTSSYLGYTDGAGGFEGLFLFYDGGASIIKLGSTGLTGNTLMLTVSDNDGHFLFENGKVGMGGITVPTANLHLYAQTTAASSAPLKFGTSSTLMTTPEAGAFECDNTKLYYTIPNSSSPERKTIAFTSDLTTAMESTVFHHYLTGDNDLSSETVYTDIPGFDYTIPELTIDAIYSFEMILFSVVISASGQQAVTYHVAYGETATFLRWNYVGNLGMKYDAITSYVDTQYGNSEVLHDTTDTNLIANVKINGIIKVAANTTARSLKLQQKLQYSPYSVVGFRNFAGSYMKVTKIS